MSNKDELLFTDGSSLGNPGPGGWAAIFVSSDGPASAKASAGRRVMEMGGGEKKTTNNRMELQALIEGLRRIETLTSGSEQQLLQGSTLNPNSQGRTLAAPTLGDLTIYIDSSYVHKGATQWSHAWKKNDWQTKAKKDVENRDLWEMLLPLLEARKKLGSIIWRHIPGHSGIAGNERADEIATGYAKVGDVELFEGDLGDYTVDILNTAVDEGVAEKRSASRAHSRAKAYSYVSLINGKVVRHTTWADCEKRVKGKTGARYKKALSPMDESAVLASWNVRASR